MKNSTRALLVVLFACGLPATAHACRYNIRDVGFVELSEPPLELLVLDDPFKETPGVRDKLSEVLRGSNVRLQFIKSNSPEGLSMATRLGNPGARAPRFVLRVRDEGLSEPDLIELKNEDACSQLIASPLAEKLSDAIIDWYAVVIFFEGSDPKVNREASRAIDDALAAISKRFEDLPKAVAVQPGRLNVATSARASEALFGKTLGVPQDKQAHAVVVYGRGRRLGSNLSSTSIQRSKLEDALWIVGQSCECDVDRRWMTGRATPIRFSLTQRRRLAAQLGFDPENPLIRSEISRLLARGPGSKVGATTRPDTKRSDSLSTYEEGDGSPTSNDRDWEKEKGILSDTDIERLLQEAGTSGETNSSSGDEKSESDSTADNVEAARNRLTGSSADARESIRDETAGPTPEEFARSMTWKIVAVTTGGFLFLLVLVGSIVVLVARRRDGSDARA
ncbi:MAG: hypothetical protein AAF488_04895 [Planctomycetota bacterium]